MISNRKSNLLKNCMMIINCILLELKNKWIIVKKYRMFLLKNNRLVKRNLILLILNNNCLLDRNKIPSSLRKKRSIVEQLNYR